MASEKLVGGFIPVEFNFAENQLQVVASGHETLVVDPSVPVRRAAEIRVTKAARLGKPIVIREAVRGHVAPVSKHVVGFLKSEIDRAYDAMEA